MESFLSILAMLASQLSVSATQYAEQRTALELVEDQLRKLEQDKTVIMEDLAQSTADKAVILNQVQEQKSKLVAHACRLWARGNRVLSILRQLALLCARNHEAAEMFGGMADKVLEDLRNLDAKLLDVMLEV